MTKRINPEDIVGQKFSRLTVTSYAGRYAKGNSNRKEHYYNCKCDCGNESNEVMRRNITNGKINSCGCLHKEGLANRVKTHGLSDHRIYQIYYGMKKRCFNEDSRDYIYYGAKGVSICDEWLGESGFTNFYNWSINNGYKDELTIERINVEGDYEPSNCTWTTMKEQVVNRRKVKKPFATSPSGEVFEIDCMADFIKENSLDKFTVYKCLKGEYRQHKGWQFEYKTIIKENDTYGKPN